MGRVSKGIKCSVIGCDKEAVRSLPIDKVTAAGLKVSGSRRAYLCKEHYKEYRRSPAVKREKMIERWRYRV
ncbi:hypothetical protein DRO55_02325 [Candidatus Bathyarchaeota archaeon]|nr:MAG: hypothetical protein DRO55_02325 [Candidatus Bathyarchaeota archaeon]